MSEMSEEDEISELLSGLESEARWLRDRGFVFPGIYAALKFLLEKQRTTKATNT